MFSWTRVGIGQLSVLRGLPTRFPGSDTESIKDIVAQHNLQAGNGACSRGEEAGGAAGSRPIGVEAAGVLTSSVQRRQPSGGGGHDGSGLQSGGGRHPGGGVGQFGGGLNLTITSTNIQRESHRIPYPRNGQDDD